MSDSLWPHGLQLSRLLCSLNSAGKNTGVGSHSLLQGIFLTQGLNPGLLHCRQTLYHLSHQGSPIILQKQKHRKRDQLCGHLKEGVLGERTGWRWLKIRTSSYNKQVLGMKGTSWLTLLYVIYESHQESKLEEFSSLGKKNSLFFFQFISIWDDELPWWLSGKEFICNAGDAGSILGSGRSPGEGNGNPLQHSCLENPMDRRAWRATVHGVAKSWASLSNWTQYEMTDAH